MMMKRSSFGERLKKANAELTGLGTVEGMANEGETIVMSELYLSNTWVNQPLTNQ